MEPCCGALIALLRRHGCLSSLPSLLRRKPSLLPSHNHDQLHWLADPVHPLLAHSVAGVGHVAHRLVDFNPTAADRDRGRCGVGVDQGSAVLTCAVAGSSGLIRGQLRAACGHPILL